MATSVNSKIDFAQEVENFRKKKLLRKLRDSKGNGTSMISIIIPPKEQISRISTMLTDEQGTASNIKSKTNKLSVLQAITMSQNKLKQFQKTPKNGLGLFVGEVMDDNGKCRKVSHAIEPIKPVNTSLYMCDSKFHVEDLMKLFEDESTYAYVVADGKGALFATLQGNTPTVLQKISEHLPKKHGKGGQSSVRFARLRVERRNGYIKKINEIMVQLYLTDSIPNVAGLILSGCTYLKDEVRKSLDPRINCIKVVDINYGGISGLNQAIELSIDVLKEVKYAKEKTILKSFLYEVNMDTGKYCFGYEGTMEALNSGAVDVLIVYEDLLLEYRETGEDFIDWITENYTNYGCQLRIVSSNSGEGTQFVEGFGGLGGLLRYKVDLTDFEENSLEELSSFSDDEEIF